jgi:hypothetical protein
MILGLPSVESHVIPAQAGIHFFWEMDPRFRGGDEEENADPAPAGSALQTQGQQAAALQSTPYQISLSPN